MSNTTNDLDAIKSKVETLTKELEAKTQQLRDLTEEYERLQRVKRIQDIAEALKPLDKIERALTEGLGQILKNLESVECINYTFRIENGLCVMNREPIFSKVTSKVSSKVSSKGRDLSGAFEKYATPEERAALKKAQNSDDPNNQTYLVKIKVWKRLEKAGVDLSPYLGK